MSSAFWSALAKLDDSLQIIQSQADCLRAGCEFDEDRLAQSLIEVRHQGATVRDLVRVERADASWSDREALERLIREIEIAAQERRNQQRRTKLQDLANELDAGRIKHRLEARAATLNRLRQEAVKQLRTEAALADQVKELPGPRASQWLHWACNLDEEKDGFILSRLRKEFGAVERFVAGMEESYWVAGHTSPEGRQNSETAYRPVRLPVPTAPSVGQSKSPQDVRPQYDKVATRSGSNGEAIPVPHNGQSTEPPSLTETLRRPEPATQWQAATAAVGNGASKLTAPPRLSYCEQCGSSYRGEFHVCPVDPSAPRISASATPVPATRNSYLSTDQNGDGGVGVAAAREARVTSPSEAAILSSLEPETVDNSAEVAGSEFERLKAIVGDGYPAEEDEAPSSLYQRLSGRLLADRRMIMIAVAACIVVLGGIFALIYHFSGRSSRPASVPQTVSAKVPDVIPDPDIQKDIEQRLATLKGSFIQVAVQDGVVTLTGKTPSKGDLVKAETLAAEVGGVKQVTNKVQVESGNGKSGRKH